MNKLLTYQRLLPVWLLMLAFTLYATAEGTMPLDDSGRPLRSITERVAAGDEDIVQNYGNISLINFDGHFSESLLQEQGAKLASIEDKDVRVSYMKDFVGGKDRFEAYTNEGILPHIKEPYREVSGELTQADLDMYMRNKVSVVGSHFKTWHNANSIHIAYMALMFLNGNGGTEYKLNRYLMFGGSVVRVDRIKAKQVRSLVGFDITADNADAYLQDYIDELYRAMVDRSYIVTGSVTYDGVQYLNNDTIYVDDVQDGEVYQYSSNAPTELKFGVNSRDQVNNVVWKEMHGNEDMLLNNSGNLITARFHKSHYSQLNRIDIEYNDGRSTVIHVLPVNLKVEFSKQEVRPDDENGVEIRVYNNTYDIYDPFVLPPSTTVSVSRYSYYTEPNLPFEDYTLGPQDETTRIWIPSDECKRIQLIAKFAHITMFAGNLIEQSSGHLKVKCTRELIGLEAVPNNYDSETDQFEWMPKRKAREGETIYFVTRNGNENTRSLRVKGLYNAPLPSSNDFWYPISADGLIQPSIQEPKWDYSVDKTDRDNVWRLNEREFSFSQDYFPGTFEWPSISDAFDDFDFLDPDSYIQVFQELDFSGTNDINKYDNIVNGPLQI